VAVLPTYFEKFVSNVQPSDERVAAVSSAHTTLRKHLLEDAVLTHAVDDSFLSGSYGRRTAIDPIKDADIILILDRKDVSADRKEPKPRAILENLRSAIDDFYEDVNLETQRRSIQVELKDDDVRMDIVPAIAPNGKENTLFVPDYEQNSWIESKPMAHIEYAKKKKNADSDGHFKRVVKAFKWWRGKALAKEHAPKSFLLEVLVAEHLVTKNSLPEAFVATARRLHDVISASVANAKVPVVRDPGVPSNDLAAGCRWTLDHAKRFVAALATMLASAEVAVKEPTSKSDSIRLWQSIFGADAYPSSLSEDEERAIAKALTEHCLNGEQRLPGLLPIRYSVDVTASVRPRDKPDAPLQPYANDGPRLPKNFDIRFEAITNVPYPYTVRWTVQNHGIDARSHRDMLRVTPQGPEMPEQRVRWEHTGYRGHHYMKCEIVRDGTVVAARRFTVNVR
jgi:hypothetical protein